MKSITTTTRHAARAGAELLVDARRRVPAPTRRRVPMSRVRLAGPVATGIAPIASMAEVRYQGLWLTPAYRTTDVHRSASGRPPG